MSATQGATALLASLKNRRQVDVPPEGRNAAGELLEKTAHFLEARETSNPQDATHQVLKDFSDWWCGGQKNTKKLAIAETGTLEVLYEHIAKMYELGAALTLGERRTEQFSFFQDIEIRGSKDNKIDYRDIAGPDSAFLRLLGRIMAELYPKQQLQVIVLDASGHSNKLGVEQTAVRLVWQLVSGSSGGQNIVVTSEIAFRIVDYMVLKANESTDQNIKEILRRASTLSNVNTWKNMFVSDDNYGGKRSTIRMTLNDEVCDPPMLRPEKRPLKPVFIHRFSREENVQDLKAEPVWSCDEGKLGSAEYAKFVERTAIRQATGTPTTDWVAPSYKGETRSVQRFQDTSTAPARQGAQIKFRSVAGSPDYGEKKPSRGPGPGRTEEPMKNLERSYPGDMQEFKSEIERALAGQDGTTEVDYEKETVTWSSSKGATIVFRHANHKVHITAKEGLCRVYLNACTFLQAASQGSTDSAMERGSTRAATSIRLGGTNGYASSRAPSQVYAPPGARSAAGFSKPMSLAGGNSTVPGRSATAKSADKPKVPYTRVVSIDFVGETSGEMDLKIGDMIEVVEDDDGDAFDRWVMGKNLKTQVLGWIPLSHTRGVDQDA